MPCCQHVLLAPKHMPRLAAIVRTRSFRRRRPLAGLLIVGAMLMPCWPRLGLIGFVMAAMVAQYIVFTILASNRRSG